LVRCARRAAHWDHDGWQRDVPVVEMGGKAHFIEPAGYTDGRPKWFGACGLTIVAGYEHLFCTVPRAIV
jgi:hypothetical protein